MAPAGDGLFHRTADIMPFCRSCYEEAPAKFVMELPGGYIVLAWPYMKDTIAQTDDVSKCTSPWCPYKTKDAPPQECPHGAGHPEECTCKNPDICDCDDAKKKAMHEEILAYIHKIEHSFEELAVAKGVTLQLKSQVKVDKKIDRAQPDGVSRLLLDFLSDKSVDVEVDGKQIATPSGRPLCIVHIPKAFHCHGCKISSYGTANCGCTKTACSCLNCVLDHVKHSAEDYEDAVKRARLGITKLQAMRSGAPANTTRPNDNQASGGDCAIPGVRKAKHLKNYTKTKKDEHNYRK